MTVTEDQGAISCTREAGVFRLAFRYDPDLVARVKTLPFAAFDPLTKSWTCAVCAQALDTLRSWRWEGVLDVDPDSLISPGESLETIAQAVLATGTTRRPYIVRTAVRDEQLYSRLVAIPGARWEKAAGGVSYPPQASVALAELVDRGVVSDPHRLLQPAAVTVAFNVGTGDFVVRGDERAAASFARNFPATDIMSVWRDRELDVAFADEFSREMYRGELARHGTGIQPSGMALDLYPYQQVDLAVILERSGIGVFSAMGVGKTALGIAAGHELMNNRNEVPRVVVIVPPAVRSQWAAEIVRFTGCTPDEVAVVDGDKKRRMAAYDLAESSAKWLIVHYQAVILPDDKKRLERLVPGALLIADECHRVKNKDAKTSKVVWALGKSASRRIGLSGTPVENNPGEWYNILSGFLLPGVFGSPIEFLNRYCYPGKFGYEGARNIPELRRRSKPLYVRHTLAEIAAHLPPLRVQTIALDPRPEYANALKRAHREAREEIKRSRMEALERKKRSVLDGYDREEIESGAEMTAVGLLKLMCCSPRLVTLSDAPSAVAMCDGGLVPAEDGPKLDELRVMCAEMQASNERVVVFTGSKRMAYLVSERLVEDGIRHVMYTGDSTTPERDAAVEAFTSPPQEDGTSPTVFLATDAGAEGLNLGRHCSTLVNLDIPWTPGRLAQRNARVRRVDSTASGFLVVNLVVRGTLEEGILRMVEHKADLADAVFGESGGRRSTTGRGGRNIFEEALEAWSE